MSEHAEAYFDGWAHDALQPYPCVYEADPIRIYVRGDELFALLRSAYVAGWNQASETMRRSLP